MSETTNHQTQAPQVPLGNLSAETAQRFAQMGMAWASDIGRHRDEVVEAYTPLVALAPKEGLCVTRDLAYGPHARQVLDLFVADEVRASGGADVVLFVHGGAFIRGRKSFNGEIYDNVAHWFARQGFVALNIEYRLAPEAPYPSGAEDVALALGWVRQHVAGFGGNPQRIFLIGHSAGGTHVATCLFDPVFAARPGPEVCGAVLISARLRADVHSDNPNAAGVRAYFGEDPACYEARSPITHAACSDVPLMVAVAEFENPYLDQYGAEFFARTLAARRHLPGRYRPRFFQMMKHNHTSIVAHFNSGETLLGDAIVQFIRR
ncbi:esterase/lipase/thioesterase [Pandoraea terrae]|uniref:Esterase/lipase/thioesterase n=1 Tax=Pandoraea terrae TaxID=1537710 RepID=A0A5E4XTK7_9BURK|nr:alpha/beta fold hydrolase [Pandoraea terrae]VVE39666.1 esterase/lipase/thioesterase [Pandoraea terrae]